MTKKQNNRIAVLVFMLPSLLGFTIFLLIPIVSSILLAFINYKGSFENTKFTLNNFYNLFAYGHFDKIVFTTVIFIIAAVILQNVLGFLFALMLNKNFPEEIFSEE